MVFLLIPVAAAGYMHYKKKKAEQEAKQAGDVNSEEYPNGEVPAIERKDSESSEVETNTIPKASSRAVKPIGPMGKFFQFCENLEKEVQKAQERNKREALEATMKQREASKPRMKAQCFSEQADRISNLQEPGPKDVVSARPRICTE